MSKDKLLEQRNRAARAEAFLRDELVIESYERLEADLVKAWIMSDPRDNDGRERAWNAVQANRKHKDYFQSVITNGKLADAELKELIETQERRKRFGLI